MSNPTSILIVAATENELPNLEEFPNLKIDSLATGVGMVATTFQLTQKLTQNKYDLVVNVGIAGAFSESLEIGSVVQISSDRLAEFGAEDHDKFLPADEMKLISKTDLEFITDVQISGLPTASGATVNRVHGNAESIAKIRKQFNPDVESMEGAAVGFVLFNVGYSMVSNSFHFQSCRTSQQSQLEYSFGIEEPSSRSFGLSPKAQ